MKTKIEPFSGINPNPVLSVEKDGTVLYSNEAGEPLLYEWGVKVGGKLPSSIGEVVQRVLSRNSPEKMEVKVGNIVYLVAFHPSPEEECVNIYGFDISEQKELEEKLRESERRLSEAQRMARVGNWDWNIVANKMYRSDEMHRIFGHNPQFDINYGVLLKYIHPDDRVDLDNAIIDTLNGNPFDNIYRIILADGEERIVHIVGEVIFDEKNRPIRLRGIVQDITENKRTEEKLRESEEKYRNIVETANEGIYLVNDEAKLTYANKKVEELSGYTLKEIIGRPIWDFISEECKPVAKSNLEKRSRGINVNYEVKLIRKDGSSRWAFISAKPFFNKDGKFTGYLGMLTDITERKIAEEKLRESEEKYRNIVEIANEGILVIDSELRVTFYNKKLMDMLGYNSEEGLGRPIWDFIKEESIATAKQHMEIRRHGVNESYELELICKDGSSIWVLLNAKSIFNKNGKFMGSISMLTDITERKVAAEALANIETARKKEIHHRIKNNLQVISSLLDLQAETFRDQECIKDSEVLKAFRESQNRVISMALIHEELYKGGGFETLNFSPYIEELAENLFLTYSVGNTDISLNMDLMENAFFDMDTAVPLGIIVNELVSNSLKHAFKGRDRGEIRIKLSRKENGECIKSINEDCSTAYVLSVSDNGVGITENLDIEDLDSLGLQLVTTLVDQLDGELELKRDNGTEFTIRFKVAENNNQASEAAPQLIK
jgi:PAS domain S-box-containing protein